MKKQKEQNQEQKCQNKNLIPVINDCDSAKSSSSSGISIQNDENNNDDMFKLKPQEEDNQAQKQFIPKTKLMLKLDQIADNISDEVIKNSFQELLSEEEESSSVSEESPQSSDSEDKTQASKINQMIRRSLDSCKLQNKNQKNSKLDDSKLLKTSLKKQEIDLKIQEQFNNNYLEKQKQIQLRQQEQKVAPPSYIFRQKGNQNNNDNDKKQQQKKPRRNVVNVYCTEYDVVEKVAKKILNAKLKYYEEDHEGAIVNGEGNQKLSTEWDLSWHDLAISTEFLSKMQPFQKVNQFPGIYVITKKHYLARNLMKMQRAFPQEYNFFPKTWILPQEASDFRNNFLQMNQDGQAKRKKRTFIVKPDSLSQGQGIFLSRNPERIIQSCTHQEGGFVVQEYLDKPHLIDDLKYDLRIYVLLYGVNPMRIFIHDQGIARFATEVYAPPKSSNMDNLYIHLTNYAINKYNKAFQQNQGCAGSDQESVGEESGHKRSLHAILKKLYQNGANPDLVFDKIKDIVVKTIICGQPYLSHIYRSCQPDDYDNSMCFQILGFDILIDKNFRPWLIEVNQSPSFGTDSPLDYQVKKSVIGDAFKLLNINQQRREAMVEQKQKQMEERILTGKKVKPDADQKRQLKKERLQERFDFEQFQIRTGSGNNYELIYPSLFQEEQNKIYENFIQKANDIWDEFTTGQKGKKKVVDFFYEREIEIANSSKKKDKKSEQKKCKIKQQEIPKFQIQSNAIITEQSPKIEQNIEKQDRSKSYIIQNNQQYEYLQFQKNNTQQSSKIMLEKLKIQDDTDANTNERFQEYRSQILEKNFKNINDKYKFRLNLSQFEYDFPQQQYDNIQIDNDHFLNIQKQSNDDLNRIKLNTIQYEKNLKKQINPGLHQTPQQKQTMKEQTRNQSNEMKLNFQDFSFQKQKNANLAQMNLTQNFFSQNNNMKLNMTTYHKGNEKIKSLNQNMFIPKEKMSYEKNQGVFYHVGSNQKREYRLPQLNDYEFVNQFIALNMHNEHSQKSQLSNLFATLKSPIMNNNKYHHVFHDENKNFMHSPIHTHKNIDDKTPANIFQNNQQKAQSKEINYSRIMYNDFIGSNHQLPSNYAQKMMLQETKLIQQSGVMNDGQKQKNHYLVPLNKQKNSESSDSTHYTYNKAGQQHRSNEQWQNRNLIKSQLQSCQNKLQQINSKKETIDITQSSDIKSKIYIMNKNYFPSK